MLIQFPANHSEWLFQVFSTAPSAVAPASCAMFFRNGAGASAERFRARAVWVSQRSEGHPWCHGHGTTIRPWMTLKKSPSSYTHVLKSTDLMLYNDLTSSEFRWFTIVFCNFDGLHSFTFYTLHETAEFCLLRILHSAISIHFWQTSWFSLSKKGLLGKQWPRGKHSPSGPSSPGTVELHPPEWKQGTKKRQSRVHRRLQLPKKNTWLSIESQ